MQGRKGEQRRDAERRAERGEGEGRGCRGGAAPEEERGETGLSGPTRSCSESIGGPDFTRTYAHSPPQHDDVGGACLSVRVSVSTAALVRTHVAKTRLTTRRRRRGFARSRSRTRRARRRRRRRFREEIDSARNANGGSSSDGASRAPPERSRARRATHTLPSGNHSRNRVTQKSTFVHTTLLSPRIAHTRRIMLLPSSLSVCILLHRRRAGCCC